MRAYFTTYFTYFIFLLIEPDVEVGIFFNWYRRFYFFDLQYYFCWSVNHMCIFILQHISPTSSFCWLSRTLKLVFSSIDIAGSISWFAVPILLKCKSYVHIYLTTYFTYFIFLLIEPDVEVGIFFNWYRRFYFFDLQYYFCWSVNRMCIFILQHISPTSSFCWLSRTLKLVFSSIDIVGSISWSAVLILLNCNSFFSVLFLGLHYYFCRSLILVYFHLLR